jgi:predicted glycogen debranching enzyme
MAYLEFNKEELVNLEYSLEREILLSNRAGGYVNTTIVGCNTRKYHGLLVASLTPPARRHVILSKLDEALEIEGKEHVLYTNMCKNYISEGYKNLVRFEKEFLPIFSYKVKNTEIKKLQVEFKLL